MKATILRDTFPGMKGDKLLLRMDPPLASSEFNPDTNEYEPVAHEYVVSSATTVLGEPETYLFPATRDGEIVNWRELEGSQKGTLSHADVLAALGYAIEDGR